MNTRGDSIMICTSDELNSVAPGVERFLVEAFDGDFSEDDFDHCLGGRHFLIFREESLVGHAAVVSRQIALDGQCLEAGYVEGLAIGGNWRGRGLGYELLAAATNYCRLNYKVSLLSTDIHEFYETHGWQRFEGESFAETDSGVIRTSEDDHGLMLLSDDDMLARPNRVTCDFRRGDGW